MNADRIDTHQVLAYFIAGPHQVFRNGWFALPGDDNDYIITQIVMNPDNIPCISWNEPMDMDESVAIVRLDTGEKWAWSPKVGEYVNTRRDK